ncbi:MAG: Hsp33 family molecular chaperone HslO [Coriobacteriales bacterium]|nr:Hsp33 family molecular chaperone HslO [Coriobacteriales bacterium]
MSTEIEQQIAELNGSDYIVRGTAANGMIRAFATITLHTVQEAHDRHHTSPVVTAALGRLLTVGAMMGSMLKDEGELMTLAIRGDGPIGGLTVTADSLGHVKGYAANPDVWIPLKSNGKLDVGGALGQGTLTVIQDQPWGEPYSSQLDLVTGEIGDDVAEYFVMSEQVPTSVGAGVLVDTDLNVRQAGGFIIQLLPGYDEAILPKLEESLSKITSVTDMLEAGLTPIGILEHALEGLDFKPMEVSPLKFYCNCTHERTQKVLITLGAEELQKLIDENKPVELVCNFCNNKYTFEVNEIKQLLKEAK